jgi:predicted HicB family RNase H-like nuclease
MLEYKGYRGRVEFDDDAGIFSGEVLGLRDVVTFHGTSVNELEEAFRDSIDDYLEFCEERGEEPDRPFSGNFMVRLSPEQHREAFLESQREGKSLNQWVAEKLAHNVEGRVARGGRLQRYKIRSWSSR